MLWWILRLNTMFCTYHNIIFVWWLMFQRSLVFCWIKLWTLVQETSWKWVFIKRTPTVSTMNQNVSLVHNAFITETTISTFAFVPRRAKAKHISGSRYLKRHIFIFQETILITPLFSPQDPFCYYFSTPQLSFESPL